MYSKELEELIENVLADGVVTEQERAVLRKRAQASGEDPDEVMVVVEGRLAKMKKTTIPAQEKRGNRVVCPACGELIEAGAVKCHKCGYVFTNVKANSSAEKFAQELNSLINKHKNAFYDREKDARDREINEFIKNFPVPTSKEDLVEFIASMDARRRNQSKYQSAYATKYKECLNKSKILFDNDQQVNALVKQTESFSLSKLTKKQVITIVIIVCAIVGGFWYMNHEQQKQVCVDNAKEQCDSLCNLINKLGLPNEKNYKEIEQQLLSITWKNIPCPDHDTDYEVNGEIYPGDNTIKGNYLQTKRAKADQIYAVYKNLFPGENSSSYYDGLEASLHAPEQIYNTDDIKN